MEKELVSQSVQVKRSSWDSDSEEETNTDPCEPSGKRSRRQLHSDTLVIIPKKLDIDPQLSPASSAANKSKLEKTTKIQLLVATYLVGCAVPYLVTAGCVQVSKVDRKVSIPNPRLDGSRAFIAYLGNLVAVIRDNMTEKCEGIKSAVSGTLVHGEVDIETMVRIVCGKRKGRLVASDWELVRTAITRALTLIADGKAQELRVDNIGIPNHLITTSQGRDSAAAPLAASCLISAQKGVSSRVSGDWASDSVAADKADTANASTQASTPASTPSSSTASSANATPKSRPLGVLSLSQRLRLGMLPANRAPVSEFVNSHVEDLHSFSDDEGLTDDEVADSTAMTSHSCESGVNDFANEQDLAHESESHAVKPSLAPKPSLPRSESSLTCANHENQPSNQKLDGQEPDLGSDTSSDFDLSELESCSEGESEFSADSAEHKGAVDPVDTLGWSVNTSLITTCHPDCAAYDHNWSGLDTFRGRDRPNACCYRNLELFFVSSSEGVDCVGEDYWQYLGDWSMKEGGTSGSRAAYRALTGFGWISIQWLCLVQMCARMFGVGEAVTSAEFALRVARETQLRVDVAHGDTAKEDSAVGSAMLTYVRADVARIVLGDAGVGEVDGEMVDYLCVAWRGDSQPEEQKLPGSGMDLYDQYMRACRRA